MKTEKGKNILLIVLIIGIVSLTIAYSALVQRLDITSTAVVQKKETGWDVHFRTVTCTASGTANVNSTLQPTASNTTKLSGLVAAFRAPGDSVTCTFYAENSGAIDAKIMDYARQDAEKTITYAGTGETAAADVALVTGKINYSLTYDETGNTNEPAVNDVLNHGDSVKMKLTLSLSNTLQTMPTNNVTISNFSTYIIYGQK